jgi:predicted small secreted protein
MKKIIIIGCLLFLACQSQLYHVIAEEYVNYQEIIFDNDGAKLLKEFSKAEYQSYYDQIDKSRFMGWKLLIVSQNEPVEFVSETKLRIFNNGFSTIKHEIELHTKAETKYQISASGSISTNIKGDIKKFKGTIDADIKASVAYTETLTTSETYRFTIIVDPKTYVTIITRGLGEINNGVAKNFFLWIETKRGGWETFSVTTEYYEIVKEKIR